MEFGDIRVIQQNESMQLVLHATLLTLTLLAPPSEPGHELNCTDLLRWPVQPRRNRAVASTTDFVPGLVEVVDPSVLPLAEALPQQWPVHIGEQ